MTARTMAPATRGAYEIVQDFAAASARLDGMAREWKGGQFKASDKSDASNLVEGLARLLTELRNAEV